jgi:hypothetical protein
VSGFIHAGPDCVYQSGPLAGMPEISSDPFGGLTPAPSSMHPRGMTGDALRPGEPTFCNGAFRMVSRDFVPLARIGAWITAEKDGAFSNGR